MARSPCHVSNPGALTAAEKSLLHELANGANSIRVAAERLGVTPRALQRRSSVICEKLGAANWREAVAMWRGREAA
jgi:DNA-binding NarL/FixJ family response regulator